MSNKPIAHILIANGVEEMEAIAPIDLLRRAEVNVKILSLHERLTVEGKNGILLGADALFEDHLDDSPDMIIIPGGPSHMQMMEDERVLKWVAQQDKRNGWIASICAGPKVLHAAGVLEDKAYTSHPTTAEILTHRNAHERVVCDGKIITSQGAGTATDFALKLIEVLQGKAAMVAVKESISF